MHGGTLDALLQKERLSLARCWQIAFDLAQGLVYLEEQGIVHRDLKPDNILLDAQGRAKLADLGIAQVDALVQASEAKSVTGHESKRHGLHLKNIPPVESLAVVLLIVILWD